MKRTSPSVARNRDIIRDRLIDLVPETARDLLEVSSGTGEHAAHCIEAMPMLRWWPTDYDGDQMASIAAYVAECSSQNLMPPQHLDVTDESWPAVVRPETADVIVNINMIHIAPWQACVGLLRGSGRKLSADGLLMLYGPFRQRHVETAASNEAFDVWLKSQDACFGLRYLEDVAAEAREWGLSVSSVEAVPANNLIAVFRRSDA